MYAIHPQLVEKLAVDFVQVIIKHFSLAVTAEALRGNIRRNRPLLKGVGHFEAKYQVEWLRLPQISVHQIEKWFYYNFAAGNFSQKRNFIADFIRLNFNFIHKNDKSLFEPPFGKFGVTYRRIQFVYIHAKRTVDFLLAITKLFSLSLTVETL